MDEKKKLQRLEEAVREAVITLEAWYTGSFFDDRQALRQLRAQLRPLGEMLMAEEPYKDFVDLKCCRCGLLHSQEPTVRPRIDGNVRCNDCARHWERSQCR